MGIETIEVIQKTEEAFGITLPDEDMAEMGIVGDFCVYVANKVNIETDREVEMEDVHKFVIKMLQDDYDIHKEHVTLKAHFVHDIGLD